MKYNPYTQESIKASLYPLQTARQSVFFSKSVKKQVKRGVRVFSVSPQSRSLFSASFQTFCLTSSETQGQIVGARESLNRRENMAQKKSKERLFSPFFSFLRALFFRPFRLSLAPTICPWVSEDVCLTAHVYLNTQKYGLFYSLYPLLGRQIIRKSSQALRITIQIQLFLLYARFYMVCFIFENPSLCKLVLFATVNTVNPPPPLLTTWIFPSEFLFKWQLATVQTIYDRRLH